MVKIGSPLYSLRAHGWLGRVYYGRTGKNLWNYPIGFFVSQGGSPSLYSEIGWCYQEYRTQDFTFSRAIRPPISEGTNTLERQVWRVVFHDAILVWQEMDEGTRDVYNKERYPVRMSGYNRFLRHYLQHIQRLMPISPTPIVDHFDEQIHDGEVHVVSLVSGDIAQAGDFFLLIKCHADFPLHCVMTFDSEGEWHREIYETPTITDDGVALTARNRNRSFADGVNATFFSGPTIGADGTLLVQQVMGAGKDEAGNGTTSEWIFKKGTNYLLKMTNDAGANKHASLNILCA